MGLKQMGTKRGIIRSWVNYKFVYFENCDFALKFHCLHDVICVVITETLHDRSQHIPGTACNYYHDL